MSPKKAYTFLIDPELLDGLKALKTRDAAPESEAIRRAIREYLTKKRVLKSPRKKARP